MRNLISWLIYHLIIRILSRLFILHCFCIEFITTSSLFKAFLIDYVIGGSVDNVDENNRFDDDDYKFVVNFSTLLPQEGALRI